MAGRDLTSIDRVSIFSSCSPDGRWHTVADVDAWDEARGIRRQLQIAPHMNPGLRHVGCHFVIAPNGAIWTGRAYEEPGAYDGPHNARSVQVLLLGTQRYTKQAWDMLAANVCVVMRTLAKARGAARPFDQTSPERASALARQLDIEIASQAFDAAAWLDGMMQPLPEHLLDPGPPPAAAARKVA